jgi:hypothetical protein
VERVVPVAVEVVAGQRKNGDLQGDRVLPGEVAAGVRLGSYSQSALVVALPDLQLGGVVPGRVLPQLPAVAAGLDDSVAQFGGF